MFNKNTYILIIESIILTSHLLTKRDKYIITIIDNLNNNFKIISEK